VPLQWHWIPDQVGNDIIFFEEKSALHVLWGEVFSAENPSPDKSGSG